jgi:hypothetical protein
LDGKEAVMKRRDMNRTHVTVLLAEIAVLFFAWAVAAADGGTIRGRVLDGEDRPVASATVVVLNTGLTAATGADGSFEFAGVPPGDYGVQASGAGLTTDAVESITVADDNTADIVFHLEPVPLREIVVTSSVSVLREEPVSTVALDREQITELPHFGDDFFRAIAVLPGTSSGDISAQFSVRGGLANETLVRMDGMELFEPYHLKDFQGVFSIFDPEMVGGVDLVPGGFSAEYGDRMAGVLDMTSRSPSEVHGSIGISFTNAWANTGGTFADGKGRWLGSLRRGYLDIILGLVDSGDDDDGAPPDPRYWDGFAMLGYDPSSRHSLSLQVLASDDDLFFEEDDPDEVVDVTTGYGNQYLWLRHQGVVSGSSFANTSLYGGRVTVNRDILGYDLYDPDERVDVYDDRELDLYGIRSDWQHELSQRQYLRWGFELRSYDARYDYENDSIIEDPIDDPRFEPGTRNSSFHDDYIGEWYSGYVSDRIRIGNRFTTELGVRYDRLTLTEEDFFSPRVNLLFNVGSAGAVRLGWGYYYQSQRPYELDVQYDDTEFYPAQRAEHFTVGYEADLGKRYTLKVDAYLRQVDDPIVRWETLFDPFHPVPELATDLVRLAPVSSTGQGVEVYLARRGGGTFDWWLSYVYSSIEDELHDGVATPRFVDQPHAFTASASWRPGPKWSLTGVWVYHTGWPTTTIWAGYVQDPSGEWVLSYDVGSFYQERLDDYMRLDFRASRTTRVGRRGSLTLFIDVQNLTNRKNQRGLAIADPEWRQDSQGNWYVAFPEEHWLPIIPSFGVSWQF